MKKYTVLHKFEDGTVLECGNEKTEKREAELLRQKTSMKIFAEINAILFDDSNDSDETMAYDEQAAAYYEAELHRIVEQIRQLEKKYAEGGE